MGASPTLLSELARFRLRLREHLGDVQAVVLFGSQAQGAARPESDVDLLIVSRSFQGQSYIARAARVRLAWSLPYPVDFLCYTPEEFERLRGQVSIVSEALREGVDVPG